MNPGPLLESSITVDPVRVLADGRSRARAIVRVATSSGEPAIGATVELSADPDTTFTRPSGATDDEGVFVSELSSRSGGRKTIGAAVDGSSVEATIDFTSVPPACAGGQLLPFAPMVEVGVAPIPVDIDGDAFLDLLGVVDGTPRLALGRGDGTFLRAVAVPLSGINGMVIRDLNQDGKPDLITADAATNDVVVSLGNGDGTFQTGLRTHVDVGTPIVHATGDFDGDSHPDIAITQDGGGVVFVLRGNGDGTLQSASATGLAFSGVTTSVVAGDFNEDGRDDLISVNADGTLTGHLALGNANGTFQAPSSVTLGDIPRRLIAASADADGHLDLTFASQSNARAVVVRGLGDGTFAAPTLLDVNASGDSRSVVVGDLDHDGIPDVAIAFAFSGAPDHELLIAHGNGDGTFGSPTRARGGERLVEEMAGGDFNGDGKLDIATGLASDTAVTTFAPYTLVLLDQNASFGPPTEQLDITSTGLSTARFEQFVLVDLDRDGVTDLVGYVAEIGGGLVSLRGRGDTFEPALLVESQLGIGQIVAGDLDRDGDPDIAVTAFDPTVSKYSVVLFLNDGGVLRRGPTIAEVNSDSQLAVADFDGDGKLDLVVVNNTSGTPLDASVTVFVGDGNGGFEQHSTMKIPIGGFPTGLVAVDLDHDGVIDLAVTLINDVSMLGILFGRGDGTFESIAMLDPTSGLFDIAAGDLDADGNLDLVAFHEDSSGGIAGPTSLRIYKGAGNRTFGAPAIISLSSDVAFGSTGHRFGPIRIDDLDRDGNLDLIGSFDVAYGRGDGTFNALVGYPLYGAIGDLDADGRLDTVGDGRVRRQAGCLP